MRTVIRAAALLVLSAVLPGGTLRAAPPPFGPSSGAETAAPHWLDPHGRAELVVDGRPFLVLAGQPHNSSAWPGRMGAVWAAADAIAINTLEAPVYWQTLEPQPGRFDFSEVDMLLDGARAHGKRLALLWFGTWKNGAMGYVPDWIKRDRVRYPRLRGPDGDDTGGSGDPAGLSPFGTATVHADEAAFAALMRHLRDRDGDRHTVILVQVENETGVFGTVRDHGAAADAAFAGPVPEAVLRATNRHGRDWRDAFGAKADEAFAAWSVARYVEAVAEAGHAADPLPFYCNAWMRYRGLQLPGTDYPSGGPTENELAIWKALTPAIGVIGTDVYTDDLAEFRAGVLPYDRPDNVPFVSESGFTPQTARWVFDTLGRGGLGASQFAIDAPTDAAVAATLTAQNDNNRLLGPMGSFLAAASHDGRITALLESPGALSPHARIGDWDVSAAFGAEWGHPSPTTAPLDPLAPGRLLLVALDPTHLLVAGMAARVEFAPAAGAAPASREIIRVEEGRMTQAGWVQTRILNGDETDYGVTLDPHGETLRVEFGP